MAYVIWADLKHGALGGTLGKTVRPADWDQLIDWQVLWPENVSANNKTLSNLQTLTLSAGGTINMTATGSFANPLRVTPAANGDKVYCFDGGVGARYGLRLDPSTLRMMVPPNQKIEIGTYDGTNWVTWFGFDSFAGISQIRIGGTLRTLGASGGTVTYT